MSWGNEHSRNAKGNRFTVDDEDLDYEDEYMSAEPTQQYTEEYYAEEEPQVAAAVNVVFLNDAQKKKEAATEARKVQSANEAKNAAYIEDSKEWLAERGFLVSDMQPDAVVALRKTIEDNENRFTEEMDSIATLQLAGVRLMTSTRRVHLSTSQDYIGLDVSFGYPSTAPTGITVNSRTPRLAAIVNHILRTTEAFRSAGILVPLVKFSHSLINAADHDDWAPEWTALTGEVPKVMEQKEALVVTHKAPSMFSAAVRERMESASRQPKKPAKHSAASTIMAFGTSGTAYIEAHGYDTAVEGARNALMDHLSNVKDAQVQMLYYANRPLGILPPVISRMYQLTQIDFSGCGLSTLPDMSELRLQKLFLSRNLFERVPQGILSGKLVKSLRILDMAFNKIDELPSALGNFVNLEIMQFDYNKIRKLCSFARLEKLEVLELTDNALTTIPKTLGQLPKLWRLKIGANPIVGMPPEIYFQGIDKIKEFLNELTPHNLPVPAATLAADIASMLAKEVNGPDVVIVHAPSGTRIPALSFIVEARAPRLLSACQVTPLIDNDDGYTHQVIVADDSFSEDALRAFVRLLHCALTSDEIRSDSALQVGLSLLVASFGNQRLSHYLHDVERGTAVDLNEILGEDLDSVAREICDNALRDCNGDKFGHIVNFGVGAQGKIFSLHRSLICQRCDYMHSMLTSGLAESKMDVVPLPDVDPEVFEAFVTYLYTDANHKLTPENVVSLLFLAVEYQCARLRDMAECMVGYNVEVDNVAQVIQLAYFLDSTRLKRACIFFVSVNYAAVRKTEGFHQLQDELKLELSRMLDGVTVK